MDFPVWQLGSLGGGFMIAAIAVIHVYVAHMAVGGGLFLVMSELYARRKGSEAALAYTRKHTKFFLLLTMVFGSLTGVGIWFTIAMLSPDGALSLIHNFTFAWATEWVFFLGEIVTLLVYFYTFDKMPANRHMAVGVVYFIFGWLSLFMINGIIGFMLTPGEWLNTRNFWDGFFNPTFWPQLFFRTFLSFSIAGIFGFVTANRMKDEKTGMALMRYSATWAALPFIFMAIGAWWYLSAVPDPQRAMIEGANPEIARYIKAMFVSAPLVMLGAMFMALRLPREAKQLTAGILVLLGLIYIGGFEFVRESGRRPFVLHGHLYSNGVFIEDVEAVQKAGWLQSAAWVKNKELTPSNTLEVGKEIFNGQCLSCHSMGGILNDIKPLTAGFTRHGLKVSLTGHGRVSPYMPPFWGTEQERDALAAYLVSVHGKDATTLGAPKLYPTPVEIPKFDEKKSEYVLLAWPTEGMRMITDSSCEWLIAPPGNTIGAVLVHRSDAPVLVHEGIEMHYAIEAPFTEPSKQMAFWENAEALYGRKMMPDTGLTGNGTSGKMAYYSEMNSFRVTGLPATPYAQNGYNPYPLVTVTAKDAKTDKVLATTRVVAPAETEIGCRNCHGGPWRKDNAAGISKATATQILEVHDRKNGTKLVEAAKNRQPKRCASCHGENREDGMLSVSAAIHGFHAAFIEEDSETDDVACSQCHAVSQKGVTKAFRGHHDAMGFDCATCHGALEDMAISLLKAEQGDNAKELLALLKPRTADTKAEINPRKAWIQEPDCSGCHNMEEHPAGDETPFNKWTEPRKLYKNRLDDGDILPCQACHSGMHAIYPAIEDVGYGDNRDNIQPLQYQKEAGPIGMVTCDTCHPGAEYDKSMSIHHNMVFE